MRRALAVLLLAACSVELPAARPGQPCSTGVCPAPLVCSEATKRCVDPSNDDRVAPQPAREPEVTPASRVVGIDGTLSVRLAASEPLARAPQVALLSTPERALDARLDGEEWVATYAARDGDPADEVELVARVEDGAGNAATWPLGTVRFDLRRPRNIPNSGHFSFDYESRRLDLAFVANEPVTGFLVLTGESIERHLGAFGPSETGSENLYWWAGTLDVLEGEYALNAHATDAAGNAALFPLPNVRVDGVAPRVESADLLPARPLGVGETLVVNVAWSELLSLCPQLELRRADGTFFGLWGSSECAGTRVSSASGRVERGMGGRWEVVAWGAADDAGNAADEVVLGELEVDETRPVLAAPLSVTGPRTLRNGDRLQVSATFSEPVAIVVAQLAFASGASVELGPFDPDAFATDHSVALEVDASTPRGAAQVVLSVRDAAANLGGPFVAFPYEVAP